jgi:hypothetical protein
VTDAGFVTPGPSRVIPLRCIVCGREYDVEHAVAERAARQMSDGAMVEYAEPVPWVRALFSDGRTAGSCTSHTDDEVRTAWVLTEWKLTEEAP